MYDLVIAISWLYVLVSVFVVGIILMTIFVNPSSPAGASSGPSRAHTAGSKGFKRFSSLRFMAVAIGLDARKIDLQFVGFQNFHNFNGFKFKLGTTGNQDLGFRVSGAWLKGFRA